MTKLIVPQIGDIVRGQVVTEAAHKLWADLADKVDALEGVANDDLSNELTALGNRISDVQSVQNSKPKIAVLNQEVSEIPILEDGYDFYTVTAIYTFATGSASLVTLRPAGTSTAYAPFGSNIHQAVADGTITCNVSGNVSREAIQEHDGIVALDASVGTATPVKWIIHKYKSEY